MALSDLCGSGHLLYYHIFQRQFWNTNNLLLATKLFGGHFFILFKARDDPVHMHTAKQSAIIINERIFIYRLFKIKTATHSNQCGHLLYETRPVMVKWRPS